MGKPQKDNAKILRSYNPTVNDKPLFSFNVERFTFNIRPNLNSYTSTEWASEPMERKTEHSIGRLFAEQIAVKEKQALLDTDEIYQGDVLISQIDYTVFDGASEVESLGLIDVYDIPSIDTWFYLTRSEGSRLLFAWIPKELKNL